MTDRPSYTNFNLSIGGLICHLEINITRPCDRITFDESSVDLEVDFCEADAVGDRLRLPLLWEAKGCACWLDVGAEDAATAAAAAADMADAEGMLVWITPPACLDVEINKPFPRSFLASLLAFLFHACLDTMLKITEWIYIL